MQPPEIIRSQRLLLRPPKRDDAEAIFHGYAQDAEVTRYLTWKPHAAITTTYAIIEQIQASWREQTSFAWVITLQETGHIIGMIALRPSKHQAEIGYVLARAAWGQGYMPEAAQALGDWVLAQPEIYRLWAVCDVQNLASARVMEKIGMQHEGRLRRYVLHPNVSPEPRDAWMYAKVREH